MNNLKRVLCAALALLFVFSLAACTREINVTVKADESFAKLFANSGSSSVPAQSQETTAPATTSPAPETTAQSDTPAPTEAKKEDAPKEDAPAGELTSSSSKEDVVAKYVEIYNKTKAQGTLNGKTKTVCTSVAIDGKENSFVKKIADLAVGGEGTSQLPPSTDSNPGLECAVKPDDIKEYKFTDNGDGTATIRLDVKETTNSRRFQGAAGNMLDVMEDVAGTVASVPALSFAEGDVNSNVVLVSSGYCEVTYDKTSNLITKGIYVLYTDADITHVNVKPLVNDKNGSASFEYTVELPG